MNPQRAQAHLQLSQPVVLPQAVAAETHASWGDFLIAFNQSDDALPKRSMSGGWVSVDEESRWRLWRGAIGDRWCGYPLRTFQTPAGRGWLLGELYGPVAQTPSSLPRLVADIVATGRGADQLNGHFLLFWWDAKRREWHVWTDRFGTLHAYYAYDGRRAALSTFFPTAAAAASRRELDWLGISGFFAQGFFPQDRTYFRDVRVLLPASHYVYDATGRLIKQARYWQWNHAPDEKRSYRDTVEDFATVWEKVMGEQYREGRIAIPISGGLDSRTTVAPFSSRGLTPSLDRLWSYSYGYSDASIETNIARRVAAANCLPFQAFTIKPYLFRKLDLVTDSIEGFQDIVQCRQAAVVGNREFDADYLIAAHWGDVWMDTMGLIREQPGKAPDADGIAHHASSKALKRGRTWLLNNISNAQLKEGGCEELMSEMTRQHMSQLAHVECPDFRVKAFKTDTWSFRWTMTSLRMFQPAAFPRLPFYDTRLTDFFCTVPSRFMHKRKLQIDYLKRYAPALARVTWQTFDTNLYRYQYHQSWLLPKRIYKKVRRMIAHKPFIQRNWEVQLLDDEGRQAVNHWLLRPGLKMHQFVSPQIMKEHVDSFYRAPLEEGRGYTVPLLLTFSTWLERYA